MACVLAYKSSLQKDNPTFYYNVLTTITNEQAVALADALSTLLSTSASSGPYAHTIGRTTLHTLASLPPIVANEDVLRGLLRTNVTTVACMPRESLTPELLRAAVAYGGIDCVPEDLLTDEHVVMHVTHTGYLTRVPKSKLTEEMLERLLRGVPCCVCSMDASSLSDRLLDAFCAGLPSVTTFRTYEWLREPSVKALRYAAAGMATNGTAEWFTRMVGIRPGAHDHRVSEALAANLGSALFFIGYAMAECEAYTEAVARVLMQQPAFAQPNLFGPRLSSHIPLSECLETQHAL